MAKRGARTTRKLGIIYWRGQGEEGHMIFDEKSVDSWAHVVNRRYEGIKKTQNGGVVIVNVVKLDEL